MFFVFLQIMRNTFQLKLNINLIINGAGILEQSNEETLCTQLVHLINLKIIRSLKGYVFCLAFEIDPLFFLDCYFLFIINKHICMLGSI